MSAIVTAGARRIETTDAAAFLRGLNRGRLAEQVGDTDRALRALTAAGDCPGIAGFMEALAVVHAAAASGEADADPFWDRHVHHGVGGAR